MSSELCVQCGICCDGTLFSRVPITATEAAALNANGIEVKPPRSGPWSLQLGCQALSGSRCTLYDVRPDSCRAFKCALLRRVEAGELDVADAMNVVTRAKELRLKAVNRELDAYLDEHFMPPKMQPA